MMITNEVIKVKERTTSSPPLISLFSTLTTIDAKKTTTLPMSDNLAINPFFRLSG